MLASILRSSSGLILRPTLARCRTPPGSAPFSSAGQFLRQSTLVERQLSRRCDAVPGAGPPPSPSSSSSSAPKVLKYKLRPLTKDDVDTSYARSSGPGGQNVNKVSTKVDMRFEVDKAAWIPDEVKDAMRVAEKNRFTKEGFLVLTSTRHRNQSQNFDDALGKMQEIVDSAVRAVTPTIADPETIKRVKANIKAGQENRLQNKKKDSERKSMRSGKRDYD